MTDKQIRAAEKWRKYCTSPEFKEKQKIKWEAKSKDPAFREKRRLQAEQRRRRNGITPKPKSQAPKFTSKNEYARWYRQTSKGRAVNSVGQAKHFSKYKQLEGSHTTKEWLALKEHYGNRCLRCKRHETQLRKSLQQDHVIPISKGRSNYISNIQPLCSDCNGMGGKGTKSTDYRT
jgi:5-methylcytosine-specific restriction endonuclease McrA